jgi:hypothetical protein
VKPEKTIKPTFDATFSIDLHDDEGYRFDKGLYIHLGTTILKFKHILDLREFIENLQRIEYEIAENYIDKVGHPDYLHPKESE